MVSEHVKWIVLDQFVFLNAYCYNDFILVAVDYKHRLAVNCIPMGFLVAYVLH